MASLELPRNKVVFGEYMPMYEPETLEEALSQFVGEVNNAVTRQRIQIVLDNWNLRHGTDIRYDNIFYN